MEAEIIKILLSAGGLSIAVGWLLIDRRAMQADMKATVALMQGQIDDLRSEVKAGQAAHMADIKKYSADITAALTTSAELMRANNGIQEKAAASATLIAEAVREVTFRLKSLEDQFGDLKP